MRAGERSQRSHAPNALRRRRFSVSVQTQVTTFTDPGGGTAIAQSPSPRNSASGVSSYSPDSVSYDGPAPVRPLIRFEDVSSSGQAERHRRRRRRVETDLSLMAGLSVGAAVLAKSGLMTKAADALDRRKPIVQVPHAPDEKVPASRTAPVKVTGRFASDFFRHGGDALTNGGYWGERVVQYGFISSMFGLGFNAVQTALDD